MSKTCSSCSCCACGGAIGCFAQWATRIRGTGAAGAPHPACLPRGSSGTPGEEAMDCTQGATQPGRELPLAKGPSRARRPLPHCLPNAPCLPRDRLGGVLRESRREPRGPTRVALLPRVAAGSNCLATASTEQGTRGLGLQRGAPRERSPASAGPRPKLRGGDPGTLTTGAGKVEKL